MEPVIIGSARLYNMDCMERAIMSYEGNNSRRCKELKMLPAP